MPVDLVLPVSMTLGLLAWGLVFRWYVHPALSVRGFADALRPILLLHAFRYVGLMFLVPGVTTQALDPRFALPAAWGDLVAALMALALLAVLHLERRWVVAGVLVFNAWGLLDLINAVARGILFTPDGALGATFWIPAVIVPLLLVSHAWVFVLLARRRRTGAIPAH